MSALDRLVAFTSRTEAGTSLALFRIGIGAVMFAMFAELQARGVVDALWIDRDFGGIRDLEPSWLIDALGGPRPGVVWPVFYAAWAASAAVLVGVGGRLAPFVALQGFMALSSLNSHALGSYDSLQFNALWLLTLGGGTQTASVDCRIRTGAWTSDAPTWAIARYLVAYQLFLMYWTTGLQKVSAFWTPGGDLSALYYILQQPTWQRFDHSWAAAWFPLTQLGTGVSWWWEILTPLWLWAWLRSLSGSETWLTRSRWVYAAIGVIFHVAIETTLEVGPFSYASLSFYAALVHPWEWARLREKYAGPAGAATPPAP
jgi:hypothetical protein